MRNDKTAPSIRYFGCQDQAHAVQAFLAWQLVPCAIVHDISILGLTAGKPDVVIENVFDEPVFGFFDLVDRWRAAGRTLL